MQKRIQRTIADHFTPAPFAGRRQQRYAFHYGGGTGLPVHASQIVLETLNRYSNPGVRASQLIAEVLHRNPAGARASQVAVEVLYKQSDPSYVRASQFVIEVLVPNVASPPPVVYPELIGLTMAVTKRPKFSTGVGVTASGREVRVAYWPKPQWEWDLSYDVLGDGSAWTGTTASDLRTLQGFLSAVYGSWSPFYFRDPDDYVAINQPLGIGDGTTLVFPFQRTYGLGQFEGTENVGAVNQAQPIVVMLNGVAQTSGITGNYVQFATAPAAGVAVTASFHFYYWCRLRNDSVAFEKIMPNLWQARLSIFSLKA